MSWYTENCICSLHVKNVLQGHLDCVQLFASQVPFFSIESEFLATHESKSGMQKTHLTFSSLGLKAQSSQHSKNSSYIFFRSTASFERKGNFISFQIKEEAKYQQQSLNDVALKILGQKLASSRKDSSQFLYRHFSSVL